MSTPPAEAKTPEEVARELARTFYEPPSTLNRYYLERLIAAALRAAVQAERAECAERASKAVLAEGRDQYEANRAWWAVRGQDPKP